jgi:Sulfatase-modifying factor enzyme 1
MLTELVELPAGSFAIGSSDFYPEEAPVRTVSVSGFAIDRHGDQRAIRRIRRRHRLCHDR